MDIVSFGTLIQGAKYFADLEVVSNVGEDEWRYYVNKSIKRYYDIVIQGTEDYNLKTQIIPVNGSVNKYPLPSDFLHCRGVDLLAGQVTGEPDNPQNKWYALEAFNFKERNRYSYFTSTSVSMFNVRYRIENEFLVFDPFIANSNTCRLFYTPVIADIVDDTDTMNVIHGFDELISRYAAEMALEKQESINEVLSARILKLEQNLKQIGYDRNRDTAHKIGDITVKYRNRWFW